MQIKKNNQLKKHFQLTKQILKLKRKLSMLQENSQRKKDISQTEIKKKIFNLRKSPNFRRKI